MLVIIATIVWFIWLYFATKSDGGDYASIGSGIGAIIPTFFYLIFWIIWLIIF
jgi:hypothetical protein